MMRARRTLAGALIAATTAVIPLINATSAEAVPVVTVVNPDGGVYWRNSPNWNDTSRLPGFGVYNGDAVALECYQFGGAVPPYNNTLWYQAVDLSRGPVDQYGNHPGGWINDHFLNTPGTAANPLPEGLPCY